MLKAYLHYLTYRLIITHTSDIQSTHLPTVILLKRLQGELLGLHGPKVQTVLCFSLFWPRIFTKTTLKEHKFYIMHFKTHDDFFNYLKCTFAV